MNSTQNKRPGARVCVVAPLYHLTLGGLGRQAQLLTEKLAKAGVNIFVITRKMEGVPPCAYSEDVKLTRLWTPGAGISVLEDVNVSSILISLVFSVGCAWTLFRRRRDYDVVHFHGARAALFFNIPLIKLLGKKIVAKVSGSGQRMEAGSLKGNYWPLGNFFARLIKSVDAFIAISDELYKGLVIDGVDRERIFRVPNFIDIGSFCHNSKPDLLFKERLGLQDRLVVTSCGRLVKIKGIDILLKAWQEIMKAHENAVLLIVGDGPMRDDLKRMAEDLGVDSSVKFSGWQDDIRGFLAISDIFVLPSLQEGLANSLLEAMSFGLPVVGTRISGTEDVIQDGVNGLLVDPKDFEGLASAVRSLIRDREQAAMLGRRALETIKERYSIEKIYPVYIDLYNSLCGEQ